MFLQIQFSYDGRFEIFAKILTKQYFYKYFSIDNHQNDDAKELNSDA